MTETMLAVLLALSATALGADPRCQAFCEQANTLCKGQDEAFDSLQECLTACPKWDLSSPSDIVGDNSLGCREFWALRVARTLKQEGSLPPGLCDYLSEGGGMCDPSVPHDCESYCGQVTAEGDCGKGPWNSDERECEQACGKFARAPKDSIRGDSLECRILYMNIGEQSTMPGAVEKYCPHIGLKSEMCSPPAPGDHACDDYCGFNHDFCDPKESKQECMQYCQALNPDALQCHLKYVAVAGRCTEPSVPCAHRAACANSNPMSVFEAVAIHPARGEKEDEVDDDNHPERDDV